MKRFAWFIGSVLIVSICIVTLLEYLYRDYQTTGDGIFMGFEQKKATAMTLYIGNSHIGALNTVLTDTMMDALNMSIGGQDLYRMYTVIKRIVPESPKLRKVMLGLDYDLIGYNQTRSGQEYIDRQYYPYVHELYHDNASNRTMAKSAFFRSNRDLSYLWTPKPKTTKKANFIPLTDDTKKGTPEECRKRAIEHTTMKFHPYLMAENLTYLYRIDSICTAYHVQLILFTTPKTACYRQHSDINNITLAKRAIDSIVKIQHLHYHDYYPDAAFSDDLFVDFDHLNKQGVALLLTKLDSL